MGPCKFLSCLRAARIVAAGSSFTPVRNCSTTTRAKLTSSYVFEPHTEPLWSITFGQVVDKRASESPDQMGWIFCHENQKVTFGQFKKDVDNACKGLLAAGFKKGDAVAIWSVNSYNWIVVYAALAKAGILSICIHPGFTTSEMEKCLKKVPCKGIYIPEEFKIMKYYKMLSSIAPELKNAKPGELNSANLPHLKTVIVDSENSLPGTINFKDIMQGGNEDLAAAENLVGIDDNLTVVFTSGTTGSSKAAVITHHGFVNNAVVYRHRQPFTPDTIMCNPLPFFHVFGMMGVVGVPLVKSTTTVIPYPGYDVGEILKAIHNYRCTDMSGSPTMFLDLIRHPDFSKYDLSSMRKVVMGGNICSEEVRKFVREKLNVDVLVGYGATETSTATSAVQPNDPEEKKLKTVGRPFPFIEMKIADLGTGKEVPIGQPGEVWIRGHNIFRGYYGDPEKTNDVVNPQRWYRSGDVGTMDEDGYISIIGRVKDIVIRGGENIHPSDIEDVLNEHPAVLESQVFGVPDFRMGEEVCAWIVPNKDFKITAEELRKFCQGKISYYKIPKYFIYDSSYPKTAIGKPQKHLMREEAVKRLNLKSS